MADEAAVIQANIVRFRELLETCTEETERRMIEKLLAEFIHKLKRLQQSEPWPPEYGRYVDICQHLFDSTTLSGAGWISEGGSLGRSVVGCCLSHKHRAAALLATLMLARPAK